jgi:hypothetical protein
MLVFQRHVGPGRVVVHQSEAIPTAWCSVRARNSRRYAWIGARPGGAGVPSANRSIIVTDGMAYGVQSSFLVKRESGRIQFSTEKYNLTSSNSFKAQGISNPKAIDISQHYAEADKEKKNPKGVTVSFKSGTLDKKGDWVPKSVNNPVVAPP